MSVPVHVDENVNDVSSQERCWDPASVGQHITAMCTTVEFHVELIVEVKPDPCPSV